MCLMSQWGHGGRVQEESAAVGSLAEGIWEQGAPEQTQKDATRKAETGSIFQVKGTMSRT